MASEPVAGDLFSFDAVIGHHGAAVTIAALVFTVTTSAWMLVLGVYQQAASLSAWFEPANVVLALAFPCMLFVVAWLVGGTLSVVPFWLAMAIARHYGIRSRAFFIGGAVVSALIIGEMFWWIDAHFLGSIATVQVGVPEWLIIGGPGLVLGGLAAGERVWRRITTDKAPGDPQPAR